MTPNLSPLFDTLRGRHHNPITGQPASDPDLVSLERRLRRALTRDAAGTPQPDGYPSLGGGVTAGGVSRPTENAALAPPFRDDVHELATAAHAYVQQAALSVAAARRKLDQLDVLTGIVGHADLEPESCESCARYPLGAPPADRFSTPMVKFTDVPDSGGVARLDRRWRLCQWCIDQVRRDPPGQAALPSEDRVRGVHEGRRARRKAS